MKILVRGIDNTSHAGQRRTLFYQWCKTQVQMFNAIKQARKEGAVTVILNWAKGDISDDNSAY